MIQDEIFFKKEGDNWYKRNADILGTESHPDAALSLIELYGLAPKKVLEIGSSNGWRLEAIRTRYGAKCFGVEPSKSAVTDGKKRYPKIALHRGLASKIPLKQKFDLVIVNYVLHWISREELFASIAEIDRMVADGGLLVIGDFAPDHPTKAPYHHLPKEDVHTFKLDYTKIFEAMATYRVTAKLSFRHVDHALTPQIEGKDRGMIALLEKSQKGFYIGT